MGEPWRRHPAWEVVERAEAAVGQPLAHLLLDPNGKGLDQTRNAQLAVLLASLLAWEGVKDRIPQPVAFAGHSLGQISALVASGTLPLEDGVLLALRRADCTQAAADRRPGRMAALLGLTLEQAEQACLAEEGAAQDCWVANDNAPGQVVVGGTPAGVESATERARAAGARRVLLLQVAGAFHTPLMAAAADELAVDLAVARFGPAEAPVVCNTDATTPAHHEWADRQAAHLVTPVRWRKSILTMQRLGVGRYYEVGPGKVLSGLVRRILPDGPPSKSVAGPDDLPDPLPVVGTSSGRMV